MPMKTGYDGSKVYLSLAGSGDPWSSLTSLRKRILRELHDTPDLIEIASLLQMDTVDLQAEIKPMQEASLIFESDGGFRPSFLVADEVESKIVFDHACTFSSNLADIIQDNYEEIKKAYEYLELRTKYGFDDIALFLVGGRILDIKLLEKLSEGNRVMPPAPSRPSPNRPDARYYFFMVEGTPVQLGAYGQDDSTMPWPSWHFITFGQNLIDGHANPNRRQLEERYANLIESGTWKSAEEVGNVLGIPIIGPSDSAKWEDIASLYAEQLCQCFEGHADSIKSLHNDLKSGEYAPHSLGEFFCWYAHIAYACAIEKLEDRGVLPIPPSRFQATIWHRARENEGMLS
ncbi:MAG: hypothetical protein ACFFDR_01135 [Candidatus Thorarchaeota archaeon]